MVVSLVPLSVHEVKNLEMPPKEWHIEGLIPVGSFVVLSAREKSGKGLACIDMAASVAEGNPFLGLETTQSNAIYLAAEEPMDELQQRISARLGQNSEAPFYLVHLDGSTDGTLDLAQEEDARILEQFVEDRQVEFLVLDVLREIHTAQEDSSTEMSPVMKRLRTMAHNHRCTIVVTHHDRKGGGARGSTAITGGADVIMQLDTDSSSPTLEGTLSAKGRGVPPIHLKVKFGENAKWEGTLNAGTMPPRGLVASDRIINYLKDADWSKSVDEIATALNLKRKTVANSMTILKKSHPEFIEEQPGTGKGTPPKYMINRALVPNKFSHLFN